eukprot:scaffold2670_cov408-Pavlova_lutheri.AAC.4
MVQRRKQRRQRPPNPLIGARVRIRAAEFGEEWAHEAHGEAWSDTWYDGVVLRLIRLRTREQEAIVRCHTSGTSTEEWPVTEETVNRYRVVEQPPEKEPQRAATEEERPTETDAGGEDDLIPPPTEVPPKEAFLDVKECATLHEEGLDPLGDRVDANEVARNGFGVVWEEEEAHVMVGSRAANGVMDRQQGYGSSSSYIPEPFCETEALQYFLRFFPYELLPNWTAEITWRGRSKYNRPGDTFLS